MVYESRVGDVFLLGSSSWRIEDITHDRVLVTPAPGQPGKMPFWHGDAPGRPLELGRALGAFLREVGSATPEAGLERARAAGLDEWGAANLLAYLAEQKAATGHLPDDRTLLVERFRDELGDWRLVVHSPFGAQVNAPWALVLAARLRERYGVDVASMHSDDGIVLRLPDTTGEPPEADLAVLDPDDVEREVTAEVGSSALFASRFRECAARALLLPRRDPRRRTPLWQQRQRAAQLLSVASEFSSFPITLEAAREVLQDVYDVPGPGRADARRPVPPGAGRRRADRDGLARSPSRCCSATSASSSTRATPRWPSAARRRWRSTPGCSPSCWAAPSCASCSTARPWPRSRPSCSGCPPSGTRATSTAPPTCCACVGDLTAAEAAARGVPQAWLDELVAARRALQVRIAGEERYVAIEDAGRLRDALGTALPVGRARGVHRAGGRSARRPRRPLRPHPRPVPARRGRDPAGPGRRRGHRDAAAADRHRPAGHRRVPARRHRPGVVRRRGAALDPPAQPGQAAPGGRAGPDRHAGPVHAVLAVGRRPAARHRRRPGRRRAAGRRAGAGQRAGVAGAAGPGARLLPRDARRADQRRRGAVGRRRRAARRRRLDQPGPGRPRAAAAARAAGGARARARRGARAARRRAGAVLPRPVRPGRRDRRHGAGRPGLGPRLGRRADQRHPRRRCAPGSSGGGTHRSRPRPRGRGSTAAGTAAPGSAGRRCRPAPGRRRWPAAGRGCPTGRPTPPGGRPRAPRRCSSGTACSPAAR